MPYDRSVREAEQNLSTAAAWVAGARAGAASSLSGGSVPTHEAREDNTRLLDLTAGVACLDRLPLDHPGRHEPRTDPQQPTKGLSASGPSLTASSPAISRGRFACPASNDKKNEHGHGCNVEAESLLLTLWPHTSTGRCAQQGAGNVVEITSLGACMEGQSEHRV